MATADTKHAAETRARRAERFKWMEALMEVKNAELDPAGKLVGVRLAHYRNDRTGECYPSMEELARATGLSESTVRRWLYELRGRGLIDFPKNRGGKSKSTQYTLTKPCHNGDTLSAPAKGVTQTTKGCQTEPQRVSQLRHPNLRTKENLSADSADARAPLADGERALGTWSNSANPEQPVSNEAQKHVDEQVSKGLGELVAKFKSTGSRRS